MLFVRVCGPYLHLLALGTIPLVKEAQPFLH